MLSENIIASTFIRRLSITQHTYALRLNRFYFVYAKNYLFKINLVHLESEAK